MDTDQDIWNFVKAISLMGDKQSILISELKRENKKLKEEIEENRKKL